MSKSKVLSAVVCTLLTATAAQAASDKVIDKPLVAQSLDGFKSESAAIREGMQAGGRYEFLKPTDKGRIESRMASMQAILEAHAGQADLNTRDKISLVNAQEEVNGILKHNDSNRLVCESHAPIGSHLPITTCRTFGEIEEQRRMAMHDMGDITNLSRTPVTAPGSTPAGSH